MTRQEFIDNVETMSDLIDFCYDNDCDECQDVYSEDGMDDCINDGYLVDWARNRNWRDLLDILSDLPTGYDWYRQDDYGEWSGIDDYDFNEYKDNVLEWGDNNDVWDAEDEEEEIDEVVEEVDPVEEEPEDEEDEDDTPDFSIGELFASSVEIVHVVAVQRKQEQAEREAAEIAEAQESESMLQSLFATA